ncbi:hypothetical protein U9M48_015034 [Paspalum notatum var. saurae]|uniref:Uncharacterized protein n=1 Tax=Paspalum notatum var. saurae TaxID=547442 RepID=A0AAQ3T5L8_PASNO
MAVACAGAWGIGGPGGPFTEAELAAADQLVQLSGSAGGDEQAASESESSPRSVNTAAAAWEEKEEGQEKVAGLGLGTELDRRATKRYRLLTELYAATRPVDGADAGDARKRKRRSHGSEAETTMRYGDH